VEWKRDAKEAVKTRLLSLESRLLTVQMCGNRKVAKTTSEVGGIGATMEVPSIRPVLT